MRPFFWLTAFAACTGGGDDDPTHDKHDTGLDVGPHCEATRSELALDAPSPLGFPAQQLVDLAQGEHAATFSWTDGTSSPLALGVTMQATAWFVDEEAVGPEGSASAIEVICTDRVEVEGTLAFTTDDGRLEELVSTIFQSLDGATVEVRQPLDPAALGGDLVFDDFHEETEVDERSMEVHALFDAAGTHGELTGQISGGQDDCEPGDICTAWAGSVDFGAWGADEG